MSDPSALEREIEETRQRLAGNIDELLHRANPKTIAGREMWTVKAHFVDPETGEPRTDHILQALGVAVGVVAAFVVLRKLTS